MIEVEKLAKDLNMFTRYLRDMMRDVAGKNTRQ